MIVQHTLQSTDTLASLAQTYLNDPRRWVEIVDYNQLDYPYIVDDANFSKVSQASGYITIIRNQSYSKLLIPAGTQFTTITSVNNPVTKVYQTTQDYYIGEMVTSLDVYVVCTVSGTFGNTPPNTINNLVSSSLQGIITQVYNSSPFVNGKTLNVKVTGDTILIATDATSTVSTSYKTAEDYLTVLGGQDFLMNENGDFVVDAYGDLDIASGIVNILQAINQRVRTEMRELERHPTYGTNLDGLIGQTLPYINNLISLYISESLGQEDRIEGAKINSLIQQGTSVYLDLEVTIAGNTQQYSLTI